jgi:hypothetical protein
MLLYIWFQSKLWPLLTTILNFRWAQKVTRPVKDLKVVCILTRNCTEGSGVCLDRMRDFFRFVNKWSSGDIGNIVSFSCVGHNSEHLYQVWLNSVQCFPSRPWKCCFTYGFKANFDLCWQRFWISHGVLRFQLSGPNFQAVYGIWLQLNLTCILWL